MKKFLLLLICVETGLFTTAQLFTSSNLPIISINTNGQTIPDDPKIMADMGIINNGTNTRNNITDNFNHYNGKIGIEIRGQSSQQFPMKSYSIELRDNAGNSVDQSLFGLPKESDWVLYAPYTDKTLMRNFLAYTMSREQGRWAANCRYVEVLLNGEYIGIYVFMEKINRNNGRVNISKMAATDISGDAVTGGYLFSIDKEADGWFSTYATPNSTANQKIRFSYAYPKISSIVSQQQDYLKSYVDSFEKALHNSVNYTARNEWKKFADETSFIDYFIVNEVSRNVDGYRLSSFFYKDRASKNGKIVAGPVWDYDLAFRNANYCNGSDTSGWAYEFNTVCGQDYWQIPFWWNRLLNNASFQENLRCRWKQLRQNSLSLTHIHHLIDSVYTLTAEARTRHFQKWPILGQYVWPNPQPIATTYSGETDYLKAWVEKRLNWLDNNMPNDGACYDFPFSSKESLIVKGNPNPVQTNYQITIKSKIKQQINVRAVDINGRVVNSYTYTIEAGFNQLQLNMSNWQKGLYALQIAAASGKKLTMKVMKL